MSAVGLPTEGHAKSDAKIREQMSGNICRCGAYANIRTLRERVACRISSGDAALYASGTLRERLTACGAYGDSRDRTR